MTDEPDKGKREMTESGRQEIKAKLIELGFWGTDEQGDPTCDYHDAQKLQDRAEGKLAKYTYLVSTVVPNRLPARCGMVVSSERAYNLAIAETYPESICLATLALPEFLRRHPECAAGQVKAPAGEPPVKPKRKASKRSSAKKAVKKPAKKVAKRKAGAGRQSVAKPTAGRKAKKGVKKKGARTK
jgi:hypothetical protein